MLSLGEMENWGKTLEKYWIQRFMLLDPYQCVLNTIKLRDEVGRDGNDLARGHRAHFCDWIWKKRCALWQKQSLI